MRYNVFNAVLVCSVLVIIYPMSLKAMSRLYYIKINTVKLMFSTIPLSKFRLQTKKRKPENFKKFSGFSGRGGRITFLLVGDPE